jgi:MFS family permease
MISTSWQGFAATVLSLYYQYYVVDVVKPPIYLFNKFLIPDGASASSLYQISVLFGSTLTAFPVGYLSDKYGRRLLLFISFILQVVAPLGFALSVLPGIPPTPFALDFVYGFLYGIGNTAFNTVA